MRRRFIDRKVEGEAQEESTAGAFATGQDWPGAPRADRPEAAAQPASTEGEGGAGAQQAAASFSDLGQHVATVLETAREAAGRIEADARSEAARLLERSRSEAQERIAGARRKAEELQAEAVRARSEANEAAEEVRARADAYAEQKRREADEAAAEVVVEAERTARERSRAAEDRQQALNANVERTEDRLRRLVIGLRELAGRLDVLVGSDALTELAEPKLEPARPPTLEEALRRHAAASEAPDELGSETEPDAQRS
jgi:cell division septum initiation protein DivIVA